MNLIIKDDNENVVNEIVGDLFFVTSSVSKKDDYSLRTAYLGDWGDSSLPHDLSFHLIALSVLSKQCITLLEFLKVKEDNTLLVNEIFSSLKKFVEICSTFEEKFVEIGSAFEEWIKNEEN